MKYKVGDIVKVRDDLIEENWYGEQDFIEDMSDYKGKYVTIARISGESDYEIKEDNGLWYWTDEMFE